MRVLNAIAWSQSVSLFRLTLKGVFKMAKVTGANNERHSLVLARDAATYALNPPDDRLVTTASRVLPSALWPVMAKAG